MFTELELYCPYVNESVFSIFFSLFRERATDCFCLFHLFFLWKDLQKANNPKDIRAGQAFFRNSINWITKYTGISLIPPWSNILLISCQRILFTCLRSPCHYNNQAELNFIYIFEMCSCISRWKPEWCFRCVRSHMDAHIDESTPYILKNTSQSVSMRQ